MAASIRPNLTGKTLDQKLSISGLVHDQDMYSVCFAMTASAILADLPILSRIQHVFMNLSTCRWFYRFFGFSLSSLSQLYRSDRASLLMIIGQIQNVCRFIYIRQSTCSHAILFSSNLSAQHFISIMFHLADDAFLYHFLWIRRISTIQSIALLNRLLHLELFGATSTCFTLNY